MSKYLERNKKLLALQAAMGGNPLPLQELKQQMGRPYTDEELEERRRYLNSLNGQEHTLQETINFFGRYEPTGPGPIEAYELPNGMMLYFNNRL